MLDSQALPEARMGRAQAGLRPVLTTGYDLGLGAKAQAA